MSIVAALTKYINKKERETKDAQNGSCILNIYLKKWGLPVVDNLSVVDLTSRCRGVIWADGTRFGGR